MIIINVNQDQQEIIDAIKIIAESYSEANSSNTKIYDGLVIAINSDDTYKIRVNGKEYNFNKYGNNTISVNQIVKVFIPQNIMNMAFIM